MAATTDPVSDEALINTGEHEDQERLSRKPADKKLSQFSQGRMNGIRSRLLRVGGAGFLGPLILYPFVYDAVSLFPKSQALSLLQGLVTIIAIPAAICFSFYKNSLEAKKNQVLTWNEQDLRRSLALAEFFTFIKENPGTVPPGTDEVQTKAEAGEWKVEGVEYGLIHQNPELLLKGMTLAHSRNYAGLGFGTITARKTGRKDGLVKEHHNIEGVLTLHNGIDRLRVFLPGPEANAQWLFQIQAALMESALVPRGSHTHELLSAISFQDLLGREPDRAIFKQLIKDQARAGDDEKQPIRVRGYRVLDGFMIATQISICDRPPVSLYQTGFFDLFTGKLRSLGLAPQVYLPD